MLTKFVSVANDLPYDPDSLCRRSVDVPGPVDRPDPERVPTPPQVGVALRRAAARPALPPVGLALEVRAALRRPELEPYGPGPRRLRRSGRDPCVWRLPVGSCRRCDDVERDRGRRSCGAQRGRPEAER